MFDCVCKVGDTVVVEAEALVMAPKRRPQAELACMRIFRHYDDVPRRVKGAVVAIGNFDGVHRGHQALIARGARRRRKRADAPLGVLAFEPHPQEFFRPRAGIPSA